MEALGAKQIGAVADRGYFSIDDIEACERAGITAYVAKPIGGKTVGKGFFSKEEFRYDPANNVYVCPSGASLPVVFHGLARGKEMIYYQNRAACKECTLRSQCTNTASRQVSRRPNEAVIDRMTERLAAHPDILDKRRECVEHPFGTIKQWMYQGAFLMRRLENVRGEFSLTALAYNIKRAITIVGVAGLIAALST
jgi:hypothetical protein